MSQEDPERQTQGQGSPSNSELHARLTGLEENVGHVVETVDRIEARMEADHEDLAERVEMNERKVRPVHTAFQVCKYGLPTAGTVVAALAAVGML